MTGPPTTDQLLGLLGPAPQPAAQRASAGSGPALHDWGTWVLAGNGLLVALFVVWAPLAGGGARVVFLNDLLNLVLGLSLVAIAGRASLAPGLGRRERWGWRWIAIGLLSYWLGHALWLYYEVLLGVEPFPSLADLAYLGFVPLTLAGVLCFVPRLEHGAGRAQFWLDTAIVVVGVGAAVWYFLLYPISRADHHGPLELILAEAYPVSDMVLLFGVVALVLGRRRDPAGRPFVWLGAGALLHFAADLLFAYRSLQGLYVTGGETDALYHVADLAMMAGPYLAYRTASAAAPARSEPAAPHPGAAPFGAVALAYGLLLYLASRDGWGTPLGGLILAAALLTALVSARQVLSARENASLRARQAIRETEARCASLIRHSSDAVLGLGEDLKVRFASPASERVLGVAPEALCGRPLLDLVHPDDRPRAGRFLADALRQAGVSPAVEWRLGGEGVGWRCIESVVSNRLADPAVRGLVLNSRDVGERRRLEDRLEQAIFHDPLTGLANRTLFRVRVEHALVRAAESGAEVAVLLLDLDDFKTVNDGLGQGQGDELLRIVAVRLLHCARGSDTAARLGGDELGLLLEDPLPLPELLQLAAAVVARMGEPVALDDHEVLVGASVGIARGGAGADADRLLRQAELAMYSAKAAGKGRFALYEPGMRTAAAERIDLEMDLRNALERGEIGLHYQPIVHLPTGAFVGAEALARWHHPRRGLVQPQAFIPLAEGRSELIVALGRLVLREACRQGAAWQARMPPGSPLHLGVNVSVRQLLHSDLVEDVASALAESGLEPRALVLEITEGTLMQGAEPILRQLRELKSIGVRLAIDDFGTGYSSLSYLHRFPIDILKIDKAFLDCMGQGLGDTRLAGAIAALAQAFGMTAVAEGVEWAAQAEAVERLGCVLAQGFHFSRPVPAEVIESEWIAPLGVGVRSCILPPESRKGSSSPECPPNKGI